MIVRLDRIQIATARPDVVQGALELLLGAELLRRGRVNALAAARTVMALGQSEVEILSPDGAGPIARFVEKTGGGIFAPGLAAADLGALKARLKEKGVACVEEQDQLLVSAKALGVEALPVVVSKDEAREGVGLVGFLYEVTHLSGEFGPAMERFADVFGLSQETFHPISSALYGYQGTLTLFRPGELYRLEMITPAQPRTTMGRFFSKRGASLYMCYAECADTGRLMERLEEHAPGGWSTTDPAGKKKGAPNNLFIHPKALGGFMIGVSAREMAWMWSGDPERAKKAMSQ